MTDERDRSPLEIQLVDTFAAHVDDTLTRDETWAAIVREAHQRDRARPPARAVMLVLATAAVLLAAIVVVRANGASKPDGVTDSITVGTAPPETVWRGSVATNQAVNVVTRAGVDLVRELSTEQRYRQLHQFVDAAGVTDDDIAAQTASTDRAAAAWSEAVTRAGLSAASRPLTDAAKQAQNRLGSLPAVRAVPATRTTVELGTTHTSSDGGFGSTISDVLSVNRAAVLSTSSVPQFRALLALLHLSEETVWRTQASTHALAAIGAGTATSEPVVADISALLRDARLAGQDFELLATPEQLAARHTALDGAKGDDVLAQLIEARSIGTLSSFGTVETSDAVLARYRALETQMASSLPEAPAPDNRGSDAEQRALLAANVELSHALANEMLAVSRAGEDLTPAERDEVDQAGGQVVAAARVRDETARIHRATPTPETTDRERRLDEHLVALREARASTAIGREADIRAAIAGVTSIVDEDLVALAWQAGSVPEAMDVLALAALDEHTTTTALVATLAVSLGTDPTNAQTSRPLTGGISEMDRAAQRFDELATGAQKQAMRSADRSGAMADDLVRRVATGEVVDVAALLAAAVERNDRLHDLEVAMVQEPTRPFAASPPGGDATTVAGTVAAATTGP